MLIEPTITWVPSGFSGYIWLDTKIVLKMYHTMCDTCVTHMCHTMCDTCVTHMCHTLCDTCVTHMCHTMCDTTCVSLMCALFMCDSMLYDQ